VSQDLRNLYSVSCGRPRGFQNDYIKLFFKEQSRGVSDVSSDSLISANSDFVLWSFIRLSSFIDLLILVSCTSRHVFFF